MGFDAQAFATAFLEGQAKDIKERFAKAEKLREEELAKAERNLPLYKKRLQQKKNMLSMANILKRWVLIERTLCTLQRMVIQSIKNYIQHNIKQKSEM